MVSLVTINDLQLTLQLIKSSFVNFIFVFTNGLKSKVDVNCETSLSIKCVFAHCTGP